MSRRIYREGHHDLALHEPQGDFGNDQIREEATPCFTKSWLVSHQLDSALALPTSWWRMLSWRIGEEGYIVLRYEFICQRKSRAQLQYKFLEQYQHGRWVEYRSHDQSGIAAPPESHWGRAGCVTK